VNEDFDRLDRRLEAITAEDCPAEALGDAESVALRKAWLAFGRLLEENQAAAGVQPRPSPRPPLRRGRRWRWAKVAVAAASVLLGVTFGRYLWKTQADGNSRPAVALPETVAAKPPGSPPHRVHSEASPPPAATNAADLSWDDSVDQAVDLVGRSTVALQQDELASTAGSSSILGELDAVQRSVKTSSFE
jgi:hypothetical protein